MVLQSLRKEQPSFDSIYAWKSELSTKYNSTKRSEEQWSVDQLEQSKDTHPTTLQKLHSFLFTFIPEIKSRILHASNAILPEIARGHFVPMLTIALACLGRIQSILMQIGRECLLCLEHSKIHDNHLFEISHDELVIKIKEVVNRLKWSEVVRKFRFGKMCLDVAKDRNDNGEEVTLLRNNRNETTHETLSCVHDDDVGEAIMGISTDGLMVKSSTLYAHSGNDDTGETSKRRKKKKRKKKSTPNDLNSDDISNYHTQTNEHILAEKVIPYSKESSVRVDGSDEEFDNESRECNDSGFTDIVKKENKKKRSRDIDDIFNSSSSNSKPQDNFLMDVHAGPTVKKVKKSKKKRGSVIDDIFR